MPSHSFRRKSRREKYGAMVRAFARWFGILYLVIGVLGFIPGVNMMRMPDEGVTVGTSYGYLLGLFPVNAVHNVVHLLIGIWGVASAGTFARARAFARGLAIVYGVLTIAGFIPNLSTLFGLTPLFGADIALHAVSAIVAAYFGWGVRDDAERGHSTI